MQRITKFSAIIGFLAVMAFVIGMFMYMPVFQDGFTSSPLSAIAYGGGGGDGGCCGGGGDSGGNYGGSNNSGTIDPCAWGGCTTTTVKPRPTCDLSGYPSTINRGESATLSWNTSNASSVSINQGIGGVSRDGSKSVSPTETTTYKLTASGNGYTVTCSKTITVRIPEVPNPVCTLNAAPYTINRGESATLTWTTDNASSVSINQGIGGVALDGNRSVSPNDTTTYTLTASGNGKTVTCTKTITVRIPEVPNPVCTLDAAPTTIYRGESATLTWTTQNADTVTLDGGTVAKNNSRVVYPENTRTFVLVATGNGKTVTCEKTIIVRIPEVHDPVCTLDGSPSTITRGQSATLTWTTDNASSVSINQGIGGVAVDGSRSVSPNDTTTYTLTASGNGKTVTCHKTIVVETPEYPNPVCTLDGSPTSITRGQSSTLTWTTDNASSVSINQGIGGVAVDGNRSVSPNDTTTYTLTASGNGKTVTCTKTIIVNDVPPGLSCDSFNASPSSFGRGGGTTNLTWNTTGATSVSIDQGVGSVSNDGNTSVNVNESKTFTLTASNGSNSVTCRTSVSVETGGGGGGGGTSRPQCEVFKASDRTIEEGDTVKLSWETRRGEELTIKDNRGDEIFDTEDEDEVDEGDITVSPKKDTTYTLKVVGKGNKSDSCTVKVSVEDENVTVTSVRDRQPVTTISFRQVPYTGFDAGPTLAIAFYSLLALWALVASYVVVVKKGSVLGFSLATIGMNEAPKYTAPRAFVAPSVARTSAVAPMNLPVATDEDEDEIEEEVEEDDADEDAGSIENRAFAAGMILSKDAVAVVMRAGRDTAERLTIADAIIARAKETYPREDGWIAIDKARIQALFK